MKMTVEIDATLLTEARALAARHRTPFDRLVEEGLRLRVAAGRALVESIPMPVHRGKGGLHTGLSGISNTALLKAADGGTPVETGTDACATERNGVVLLAKPSGAVTVAMQLVKQPNNESP